MSTAAAAARRTIRAGGSRKNTTTTAQQSSFLFWAEALVAPLYLVWRAATALHFPVITDCDEVYNYWEPLHFLLFGQGQQTWEYAHEFQLRTYAYLVPLQWLAEHVLKPYVVPLLRRYYYSQEEDNAVVPNEKIALFLSLRLCLALLTAGAELRWLYALGKTIRTSTTKTVLGGTTLVLVTATGMHHASAAYLPSATWMAVWCYAASCFLQQQHYRFVLVSVAATLATGWPFGAVSVLPMPLHLLLKEYRQSPLRFAGFLLFVVSVTVVVQALVMWTDRKYYGVWTSPTYNIFTYNAAAGGDELYGVEPVSYYAKNLLLNLNAAAPLGLLALPVYLLLPSLQKQQALRLDWNVVSMLLSLPAWLAVTVPRPHKEERFLFPVYPVLVFGAVLTVDTVLSRVLLPLTTTSVQQRRRRRMFVHTLVWIPVVAVSLGRTAALWKYYSRAPLRIYSALPSSATATVVCTCGEWYRFPSSFYLPSPGTASLGFLPSSFQGQLPQPFSRFGSRPESEAVLQPFNDRNREEKERYVSDVRDCQYMIDLASGDCASHFVSDDDSAARLEVVAAEPFLHAAQTTSTLHRTLYVPFWHERAVEQGRVVYDNYVLYRVVIQHSSSSSANDDVKD